MLTETLIEPIARARLELAQALDRQKRHERHRRADGRRCHWCGMADDHVIQARAKLAELEADDDGAA